MQGWTRPAGPAIRHDPRQGRELPTCGDGPASVHSPGQGVMEWIELNVLSKEPSDVTC
jgi:hypothetical protein